MIKSTTAHKALLIRSVLGKNANRLNNKDTQKYLSVHRALNKALAPQIEKMKEFEKEQNELVVKFREQEAELVSKKAQTQGEKEKEAVQSEIDSLPVEYGKAVKPLSKKIEEQTEADKEAKIEITFDENAFAWIREHVENNGIDLAKNQDGSVNNELLEDLFCFVGLSE
jgi:septal ring factor EnvC (AmiA/AmiB activator)